MKNEKKILHMKDNVIFSAFEAPVMPECKEVVRAGYDYVSWGQNNQYPQEIYDLYMNSAVLQSIINGICDYVYGGGMVSSVGFTGGETVNDKGETLLDVVKKCVVDYVIFGGFSLQIMYKGGNPAAIYWLDFMKCRKSEDEKKVYYSDKWGSYNKKCLEYSAWTPETHSGTCIFYFKGHKTRGIYPVPMYVGAMKSVKISTEISNFHLNNITSGFAANCIVSFNNGVPDDDTKARIEKDFKDKFCGSDNAGSFMLLFNDSKDNAVEIARIEDDKFDQKFQALSKSTMDEIFVAFRATPELFGISTEGNGFSKEEYMQAFSLFNKTVVGPIQTDIEKCFAKVGFPVKFMEFKLTDTEDKTIE